MTSRIFPVAAAHFTDARSHRVLVLLPYPVARVPSQRYRIEQWRPLLQASGFEITYSEFLSARTMDVLHQPRRILAKLGGTLSAYVRRVRELSRPPACDVVFLHREAFLLGPTRLERTLLRRIPFVYDFDDAIYLRPMSVSNRWAAAVKSPAKPAALCGMARHVTVGNEVLAQFAKRQSADVSVIPSTIDTEAYRVVPRAPGARPVIGWTGSPTTVEYLRTLHRPLIAVRREIDFELRVIGASVAMPGLDVRCSPWHADTEADDLRSLDIGLMPLPDDPWTRGKCGMKALQYMALAIPPIVSPVGANRSIVVDGVNGFHARNEVEWGQKITILLHSAELRSYLGLAGRKTVEREYSAQVQVPRVARILASAARISTIS